MVGLENELFEKIKENIIKGSYKEGEYINVSKLSEGFKVSQVPIREVMIRLAERGLLIWEKKRGFKVASCSINESLSLLQINHVIFTNAIQRLRPVHVIEDNFIEIENKINRMLNDKLPCWIKFTELFFEYGQAILSQSEYHLFRLSYDRIHQYRRYILSRKSQEITHRLNQLNQILTYTYYLKKKEAINSVNQFIDNEIESISYLNGVN